MYLGAGVQISLRLKNIAYSLLYIPRPFLASLITSLLFCSIHSMPFVYRNSSIGLESHEQLLREDPQNLHQQLCRALSISHSHITTWAILLLFHWHGILQSTVWSLHVSFLENPLQTIADMSVRL
jgi:hypothetical protein